MRRRIVNKFHWLRDRHILRVPPRAKNPYLTHFPVLLAMQQWLPLRSVLEFGSGESSTKGLLNKDGFPLLVRLESYENDAAWAARVRMQLGHDERLTLNLIDGPICAAVQAMDLEAFDLVLIDDSLTLEERSSTIRAVAAKRPQRPVVVIHDFEQIAYREAAKPFRNRYRVTGQNPNVGVAWNSTQLAYGALCRLDRRLRVLGERSSIDAWFKEANALTVTSAHAKKD